MKILLLNGPNLGRLGKRQPEIYGSTTLAEVEAAVALRAAELGHSVGVLQSNHEGTLIDRIEERDYDAIVINPGALTHYIMAREPWRHVSVIEPVVSHRIMGRGWRGYLEAIDFLHELASAPASDETPED